MPVATNNNNMTPQQAYAVNLMGSDFQNSESETILRNVILQQRSANPAQWTPFTWDEYREFCQHNVSVAEKGVLDAFVNGGKPVWNCSVHLSPGWFSFEDGRYMIGQKTIAMLKKMAKK